VPGSQQAHQAITEIMRRQAAGLPGDGGLPPEHAAAALPLRVAYVEDETGRLVVGIDRAAQAGRAAHEQAVRAIAGDADLDIRYVGVARDACPDKKQDCRPLRGGVRMNGDATLNLVITQLVSGAPVSQAITSSHAVGPGTGQSVGQSPKTTTYGAVIRNPSLANRASDAALTSITNQRITGSPYAIWRGAGVADYIVNDFAISLNTPVGMTVCLQGAMQPGLQPGRLLEKNVTVTDQRGTLTGQVYAGYTAAGGDSGGPVFYLTEHDGYVVYAGIHAGRVIEDGREVAYYSPWEGVQADLQLVPVR
jgi:hypothetical protein